MSAFANKVVGQIFQPIDPIKAARRIVLSLIGTAVLTYAALITPAPFSWLLWVWLAWRAFGIALLLSVVGPANAERERRLSTIPPSVRAYLIDGVER